ncbi:MAG: hypothetical protein Q7J78_03220 [Clostridiales bacterium]|nr:hypothetical protein [Clostridiales bacterium]
MKESMYRYMKVGLVSFSAYPKIVKGDGAVSEVIARIARDSYSYAIEITHIIADD